MASSKIPMVHYRIARVLMRQGFIRLVVNMFKTVLQSGSVIAKMAMRKRIHAFAVTSLAVFVVICLMWPLSVTSYRSVVGIGDVGGDLVESKVQLEQTLSQFILEETADDRLDTIVAQIEAAGKLSSKRIEYRDHQAIRESLKVGIREVGSKFEIRLALDGEGGEDDRELVNILAMRVAKRFVSGSPANETLPADESLVLESPSSKTDSPNGDHIAQLEKFDEARWILKQIEDDLSLVKSSIGQTAASPMRLPTMSNKPTPNEAGSHFQYASSSKVVAFSDDELRKTIESIDTQSLRSILNEIQIQILNQSFTAESQRVQVVADNASFSISSLNRCKTFPLQGVPSWGSLFALGLISVFVGATVARRIEPFQTRGFDGVDTIGRMLGLPVVAEIRSDNEHPVDSSLPGMSWPNRIVQLAGSTLFGIFLVVAGFVMINSEVRFAFFENPLFGCAKILRIFTGY